MLKEPKKYEQRVREYVKKYAFTGEIIKEMLIENIGKIEEEVQNEEGIDIEDDQEKISLSDVSELSETSDIGLIE